MIVKTMLENAASSDKKLKTGLMIVKTTVITATKIPSAVRILFGETERRIKYNISTPNAVVPR